MSGWYSFWNVGSCWELNRASLLHGMVDPALIWAEFTPDTAGSKCLPLGAALSNLPTSHGGRSSACCCCQPQGHHGEESKTPWVHLWLWVWFSSKTTQSQILWFLQVHGRGWGSDLKSTGPDSVVKICTCIWLALWDHPLIKYTVFGL